MTETPAVLLINCLGTGGAERAVAAAVAELRRRGREVRVVCLERCDGEIAVPDARLSRMRADAGALLKLAALPILAVRLSRYLTRNRAELVMSHLFRANFVNVLARLVGGSRHRVIVVNHTRLSRLFSEGLQGRINWRLCRWLYRKADLVASVSRGAASETGRLLALPTDRSVTLHDPVHLASAATPPAVHAFACVGRLVALKRFQDVVAAFARVAGDHPRLQLRIAGDGPERERLRQLSARLGVPDRVAFLGTVSDPSAALAGCTGFISSSETEGFGMAIVEALAARVPVIASDCAYGPREILSPGSDPSRFLEPRAGAELAPYGILYPVGSVDALENAMRCVLDDEELRSELARNGPRRAEDFSIDRSASEYERLLFPG